MTLDGIPTAVRNLADLDSGTAAFDADGVLWYGDVSEDFARWMIGRGEFRADLWDRYLEVNELDSAAGCLEILRLYAGLTAVQIRERVQLFWQRTPPRRWVASTSAALRMMAEAGHRVFVVSGTPSPVLGPLAGLLPVGPAEILALDLEFDSGGRATGRCAGIATTGAGKARRLRAAAASPILLAVGNSSLDIEMLRLSSRVAWAFEPDADLRAIAQREGWLITEAPDDGGRDDGIGSR